MVGGGLVKVLMQVLTVRPTQIATRFPIFSLSLLIQKEICRPLFQPSGDKGGFLLTSEKAMAPHSWKIPRTEEPGRLQSMGWLRVGHH